jgi:L-lactate utilization protein LutB
MKEKFDEVLEEMIQDEAESLYDRWLTKEELIDARGRVCSDLYPLIQDKLRDMEDEKELIERSQGAELENTHFKVIWKNENAFCKEFKPVFFAKTYEDAKEYLTTDDVVITEYDQYKIIKVENGVETEVETIGEGLSINAALPPQDSSKNTDNN